MRVLADIATALRLVLSAFIVYAGLAYGQDAFGVVIIAIVTGWTLDTVDGHLARAAGNSEPSWWGRNDRYIDVVLVLAGGLYLTLIGVVPAWLFVTYVLLGMLLFLRFRSIALLTALEAPLVLLLPVAAFVLEPLWGWVLVVCGVIGVVLDRRRLWVRAGILWNDIRGVEDGAEYDATRLSVSDQHRD